MDLESGNDRKKRKILLNAEIKSMLGPCMISFSIPLFIPGWTITLVAFSDETGFSKYGVLHVIGIVILSIACILLVFGCVMRCACRSKIYPLLTEVPPQHKVTTHEKPKHLLGRTLTKERLPPLNHGPQPGGSSVLRDHGHIHGTLPNPHRVIDSEISESDSEDMTSTASEEEDTSSPSQTNNLSGLPGAAVINGPMRDSSGVFVRDESSEGNDSQDSCRRNSSSIYNGTADSETTKTTLLLENELDSRKANLMCPSFTDMRQEDAENVTIDVMGRDAPDTTDVERRDVDPFVGQEEEEVVAGAKPVAGWVSGQSHDKASRGSKFSSETPSSYESSDQAEDRIGDDDEGDDVTLTSRNCSTVPEIADLERDDSVEVDRFTNVWRGESQNSVEISSVLSQDEYSEESLSVVSKDQLEPTGSRGRASSDSALESGGDHSRALSQRYLDRVEVNNGLIEEDLEVLREQGEE